MTELCYRFLDTQPSGLIFKVQKNINDMVLQRAKWRTWSLARPADKPEAPINQHYHLQETEGLARDMDGISWVDMAAK